MSARKPTGKCVFSYVLLLTVIIVAVLVLFIHKTIMTHINELIRYKCSELVNNMIYETISELGDQGELYRILRDEKGSINSVCADTDKLNILQNELRNGLNRRLASDRYNELVITLGDLTDITYFSGRGFELHIGFQQTGAANTEIVTEFTSAGVNQTRFRASIIISAEFKALSPYGNDPITVTQEYVAADEVIVGAVPSFYGGNNNT